MNGSIGLKLVKKTIWKINIFKTIKLRFDSFQIISTADISAILFEANPTFKAKIEKELPNYDKSQRDTKDGRTVTKKFVSACDKLSLCMIDQKNLKNRFTAQEC